MSIYLATHKEILEVQINIPNTIINAHWSELLMQCHAISIFNWLSGNSANLYARAETLVIFLIGHAILDSSLELDSYTCIIGH